MPIALIGRAASSLARSHLYTHLTSDYSKPYGEDPRYNKTDFFIVCHSYLNNELSDTAAIFQYIRRIKGIAADVKVLPVFLAV